MATIGYARVSTDGQTLDVQIAALKAAGAARIYRETASGAKAERKELARALKSITAGDTLLVTRLDRLARSTRDLLNILDAVRQSRGRVLIAARHHRLNGLEPENLLAFMALVGLLGALDSARADWRARAFWDIESAPLRPTLELAEEKTPQEIAAAAAEGAAKLGAAFVFDRRDLNYSAGEARNILLGEADAPRSALFNALLSDGAVRDDGRIWPTPLCFLFGQGHQHFLDRLSSVTAGRFPKAMERIRRPDLNDPALIAATLFDPWTRSEHTDSFRWDPLEDRRYALRARDPSGYPSGTQHETAHRLASERRRAKGPQAVEDGRLDVEEALAVPTKDVPRRRVLGQRRGDGVVGGFGDGDADHALTATFRYFVDFLPVACRCASAI